MDNLILWATLGYIAFMAGILIWIYTETNRINNLTNQKPKFCKHVYEDVGSEVCPFCRGYTHKTNWEEQHRLHKEWIASGKATAQGWWSI